MLITSFAGRSPVTGTRGGAGAKRTELTITKITMPKAMVRLSAGRQEMSDAVQALCFLAGANSIFYGDKLLTTGNPEADEAMVLDLR